MKTIKVAFADDHEMIRESMIELLQRKLDIDIVVSAKDGKELVAGVMEHDPDLVILDINMPKKDGVEVTKILKEKKPDVKILIWTSYDDESLVMKLVRLKVNGYITKDAPLDQLIEAIASIIAKGYYLNESMSLAMYNSAARIHETQVPKGKYAKLDKVDIAILKLLCEELTAKEIADKLNISARTVEGRRKKMMQTLGVKNQIGLALYAFKNNIYPN
jgi:DNA-binding NarL/FixJ family response regulator